MPHYATFHLGLHCLPKYLLAGIYNDKRVAHLRMTVYKGIGKHSSSQSPAMNFDRSAVTIYIKTLHGLC